MDNVVPEKEQIVEQQTETTEIKEEKFVEQEQEEVNSDLVEEKIDLEEGLTDENLKKLDRETKKIVKSSLEEKRKELNVKSLYEIPIDMSKVKKGSDGIPIVTDKDITYLVKMGYDSYESLVSIKSAALNHIKNYKDALNDYNEDVKNGVEKEKYMYTEEDLATIKGPYDEGIKVLASMQLCITQGLEDMVNSGALQNLLSNLSTKGFIDYYMFNTTDYEDIVNDKTKTKAEIDEYREKLIELTKIKEKSMFAAIFELISKNSEGKKGSRVSWLNFDYCRSKSNVIYDLTSHNRNQNSISNINIYTAFSFGIYEMCKCIVDGDMLSEKVFKFDIAGGFRQIFNENYDIFSEKVKKIEEIRTEFAKMTLENSFFKRHCITEVEKCEKRRQILVDRISSCQAKTETKDLQGCSNKTYSDIVENSILYNSVDIIRDYLIQIDREVKEFSPEYEKSIKKLVDSVISRAFGFEMLDILTRMSYFIDHRPNMKGNDRNYGLTREIIDIIYADLSMNMNILRNCENDKNVSEFVEELTRKFIYKSNDTFIKSFDLSLSKKIILEIILDQILITYQTIIEYYNKENEKLIEKLTSDKGKKTETVKSKKGQRKNAVKYKKSNKISPEERANSLNLLLKTITTGKTSFDFDYFVKSDIEAFGNKKTLIKLSNIPDRNNKIKVEFIIFDETIKDFNDLFNKINGSISTMHKNIENFKISDFIDEFINGKEFTKAKDNEQFVIEELKVKLSEENTFESEDPNRNVQTIHNLFANTKEYIKENILLLAKKKDEKVFRTRFNYKNHSDVKIRYFKTKNDFVFHITPMELSPLIYISFDIEYVYYKKK